MGNKGLGEENSGTLLCQLPPHPGNSLFCPPEGMELGSARIQQPQVQDSSYRPKGLNEKAMQVEVRVGGAASVHQPPLGKFAGKPLLASEHLQFFNSTVGTWSYHLLPQEVWERRQKKVDSFIRDPADSRDPREFLHHPAATLGCTSR